MGHEKILEHDFHETSPVTRSYSRASFGTLFSLGSDAAWAVGQNRPAAKGGTCTFWGWEGHTVVDPFKSFWLWSTGFDPHHFFLFLRGVAEEGEIKLERKPRKQ